MRRAGAIGHAGFTLVEVMLVCGMVGLIAAIAVPSVLATVGNYRLKNAAYMLAADIRLAQAKAQEQGKRTRLVLVSDPATGTYSSYEVQAAISASAAPTCTSVDYSSFKRVNLESEFGVHANTATLECLVFEATGRTAWANPVILEDPALSDAADGTAQSWARFFDGIQKTGNARVIYDDRVNKWTNRVKVTETIDLGQLWLLDSICPEVLEKRTLDGVYFPASIQVYWSSVTGDTPPTNAQWQLLTQFSTPYSGVEAVPGSPAIRVCPQVRVNDALHQRVRYLRFVFNPTVVSGANKTVAADEFKMSLPVITLGSFSRPGTKTLTIFPVTGRISVN